MLPLLFSLLFHVLLLSLTFGGQEFGLPGFAFPWQARRAEVPDLHVVLAPAAVLEANVAVTPEPSAAPPDLIEPSVNTGPAIVTFRIPELPTDLLSSTVSAQSESPKKSRPAPKAAAIKPLANTVAASEAPPPPVPAKPFPAVIALDQVRAEFVVPPAPVEPVPDVSVAQEEAAMAAQARVDRLARERVAEETERAEAARRDAASAESARLEAERKESLRQAAERQEAAQREVAQREVAQREAADQEARRQAVRRAIGRQLDEEAARREAAQAAARLSPTVSSMRRGRLFGRADPNADLLLYAEDWSRKIHLNMGIEMVREAAKQAHTDPLVTVAIRSDGSVESVTFVRSSGVPAIDDAIRNIVQSHAPYQPFPPGLLRHFDVIEIRRTWHFDSAIRLY